MGSALLLVACLIGLLLRPGTLPIYSRWLYRQPIAASVCALLGGILFGFIGQDLGLGTLFWHEDAWTQFVSGLSVGVIIVVLGIYNFLLDDEQPHLHDLVTWMHRDLVTWMLKHWRWPSDTDPAKDSITMKPGKADVIESEIGETDPTKDSSTMSSASQMAEHLNWLGLPLILALFTVPIAGTSTGGTGWGLGRLWLPIGALLVWGTVMLLLVLADQKGVNVPSRAGAKTASFVLIGMLLLFLLAYLTPVRLLFSAASSICLVLLLVVTISFVTYKWSLLRVFTAILLLFWTSLTNGCDPFKYRYPGLKDYYPDTRLDPDNRLVNPPPPVLARVEDHGGVTARKATDQAEEGTAFWIRRSRD